MSEHIVFVNPEQLKLIRNKCNVNGNIQKICFLIDLHSIRVDVSNMLLHKHNIFLRSVCFPLGLWRFTYTKVFALLLLLHYITATHSGVIIQDHNGLASL